MANTLTVSFVLGQLTDSIIIPLELTLRNAIDVLLPAGTVDMAVSLGAVVKPELILVYADKDDTDGGKGIGIRFVASSGSLIPAQPVAVITKLDGLTQNTIYLSNSDTAEHLMHVVFGE
jgi:hypothetical protein